MDVSDEVSQHDILRLGIQIYNIFFERTRILATIRWLKALMMSNA
jgi:hypothetical protein